MKCESCEHWKVLNPHQIKNGRPVKGCDSGEVPERCKDYKERRTTMKALSFRDPWGYLVASGYKDVDNRNWSTKFRGRIYIHVSKTFDQYGLDWIIANRELPLNVRNLVLATDWPRVKGAIIGEVDIVDCVEEYDSPWFVGKFGLVLKDAKPYESPIPCKGKVFPHFFEPDLQSVGR